MHRADAPAAAFLGRDGVIYYYAGFVHDWSEFRFLPGVVDALYDLQEMGHSLIVITNQSDIARGMYAEAAYQVLTARLKEALLAQGVRLSAVYHCPHHPDGKVPEFCLDCDFRKQRTCVIEQALRDFDLNLETSIRVGDKSSDLEAGRAAGIGRPSLSAARARASLPRSEDADARFDDLANCVVQLKVAVP